MPEQKSVCFYAFIKHGYNKRPKGHIPGETNIEDIALLEALNFPNIFPVCGSILQHIPSAPAV